MQKPRRSSSGSSTSSSGGGGVTPIMMVVVTEHWQVDGGEEEHRNGEEEEREGRGGAREGHGAVEQRGQGSVGRQSLVWIGFVETNHQCLPTTQRFHSAATVIFRLRGTVGDHWQRNAPFQE